MRSLCRLLLLTCLSATPAVADPIAQFDRFARAVGPYCITAASTSCYARAFAYADADGDGTLTLAELQEVQAALRGWAEVAGPELTVTERSGITLGLVVVDTLGLERLFASYDRDGDGRLTPEELGADVALDDRPLPVLVRDPSAIDWTSVRGRLGVMAGFVLPQLGLP